MDFGVMMIRTNRIEKYFEKWYGWICVEYGMDLKRDSRIACRHVSCTYSILGF